MFLCLINFLILVLTSRRQSVFFNSFLPPITPDTITLSNSSNLDLSKFLNYDELTLGEAGNVKGLSEQIASLKENKPYLFEAVKQASNNSPANPVNVVVKKDLNEQWQEAVKNGNQALAIALKNKMYNI